METASIAGPSAWHATCSNVWHARHADEQIPGTADGTAPISNVSAAHGCVLVVEDDELQRRVLTRILRREGYWAEAVANAEQAVRAFDAAAFELVVSDIDVPGQDGITLLRAIRQRDPNVPGDFADGSA